MELFLSSSQPVVGVWRAVLIVSKELERAIFCRIFHFCGWKCPPPPAPLLLAVPPSSGSQPALVCTGGQRPSDNEREMRRRTDALKESTRNALLSEMRPFVCCDCYGQSIQQL